MHEQAESSVLVNLHPYLFHSIVDDGREGVGGVGWEGDGPAPLDRRWPKSQHVAGKPQPADSGNIWALSQTLDRQTLDKTNNKHNTTYRYLLIIRYPTMILIFVLKHPRPTITRYDKFYKDKY